MFGGNESRKEKLETLLIFLKILKSLGCNNVYVVGSFVTNKEHPNDIDICVDITYVDYVKLKKEYPELLHHKGIDQLKKEHKIHFALFFDFASYELLDYFKKDRDDNARGLVKIYLNDIDGYD
ncbi:MAG: hypothetical protein NTW29_03705 [Bacteroidetes bacterium]|nr:hypothetical protein [Bacteroidota bacterium]